jgi:single-stranded DNA-binding protein
MNPISVTVTGLLGDDPKLFDLKNGGQGLELSLALELPARGPGGREITRWVKVKAFDRLATSTAASVGKGDRVIVIAHDITVDAWTDKSSGEPRGRVVLVASDIAASMLRDTVRTGYADRKAARLAAANGQPNDLDGAEQAEMRGLAGVTTS